MLTAPAPEIAVRADAEPLPPRRNVGLAALVLLEPSVMLAIVGVGPRVVSDPTAGGVAVLSVLVGLAVAPLGIAARRLMH
ncbi:MAG: hypothetical protein KC657_12890 [Myxococcales bacterium]|nr:hypothetical protein [Myxococcales bacterium]